MNMRTLALCVSLAVVSAPGIAAAKGCLKGAAVGGVAGHVAGSHGVAGAAVGCAIGHHNATVKAKKQAAASAKTTEVAPANGTDANVVPK